VIRQPCTEITHITVHEVLDRSGYSQLGRICFSGVDLTAFIADAPFLAYAALGVWALCTSTALQQIPKRDRPSAVFQPKPSGTAG
jgi:hypothetical protein